MSKPLEDKELIEMFADGISIGISAIKPSVVLITHVNGGQFMMGLLRAATAANGLAHTQSNPRWLAVRDAIEEIAQTFKALIIAHKEVPRARLTALLQRILLSCNKMATDKAVKRQDVLVELDKRQKTYKVK